MSGMDAAKHGERIMVAADAYARAFARYGYGPEGDLRRNALKGAISVAVQQHAVAVAALREVARIGTEPRDSMLSKVRDYEARGQAMLDVANAALDGGQ